MPRLRAFLPILICAGLAVALPDESKKKDNPFKGPTRDVRDVTGQLVITVPVKWKELKPSGTQALHLNAPSAAAQGGHRLSVVREVNQKDAKAQRKRYRDWDGGKDPEATFKNIDKPFLGYRLETTEKGRKLVILRRFLTDGDDGLVLSIRSRLQNYDKIWARQIMAVAASLRIDATGAVLNTAKREKAKLKRFFGHAGLTTLLAPETFKPVDTDDGNEVVALALGGASSAPRLSIQNRGSTNAIGFVLTKTFSLLKKAYPAATRVGLEGKPPRMLVRNRKPGWVDYMIAMEQDGIGYTLTLSTPKAQFERYRGVADEAVGTVVFLNAKYTPPEAPAGLIAKTAHGIVVYADPAKVTLAESLLKVSSLFPRQWKRFGIRAKGKEPLVVQITSAPEFKKTSDDFGERPAVYHAGRRIVYVVAPSQPEEPIFRGKFFVALTDAILHRDIAVKPPGWFREGIADCMEVVGRSGKGPDGVHRTLGPILTRRAQSETHADLSEVLTLWPGDFRGKMGPENRSQAWGYFHFMNFGKGKLPSIYKKWVRSLANSKRGVPEFKLGKYKTASEDFRKYVLGRLGK